MSTSQQSGRWIRTSLGILQIIIGLGAVAGGYGLMADPTGASLGLPLVWLEGSPFANFLIPGLFLFTVNGLGTLAGSVATFKSMRYAGEIAIGLGIIMMLWILIQVAIISLTSFLQPLYFGLGILEIMGGLLLRKQIMTA